MNTFFVLIHKLGAAVEFYPLIRIETGKSSQ